MDSKRNILMTAHETASFGIHRLFIYPEGNLHPLSRYPPATVAATRDFNAPVMLCGMLSHCWSLSKLGVILSIEKQCVRFSRKLQSILFILRNCPSLLVDLYFTVRNVRLVYHLQKYSRGVSLRWSWRKGRIRMTGALLGPCVINDLSHLKK